MTETVRVTVTTTPGVSFTAGRTRTLFLTTDADVLDPTGAGKARVYSRFSQVAEDFDSGSAPYDAAQIYFGQSPYPRALIVGRWTDADQNKLILGGTPATLTALQAITSGTLEYPDGVDVSIPTLANATSFSAIAVIIQAAIRAASGASGSEDVTYESSPGRFRVDIGSVSGGGSMIENGSSGTLGDMLGLTAVGGAVSRPGGSAEAVGDGLDAITALQPQFLFVVAQAAQNDTAAMRDIAAWAAANQKLFSAESNEAAALVTNEATSELALLATAQPEGALATFSRAVEYKALSIAARFSGINLDRPRSLVTAKFLSLPGTSADLFTETELTELRRKDVNFYRAEYGIPIYAEGQMLNGAWIDDTVWLRWIVDAIQQATFNHLLQSGRVSLTPAGIQALEEVIEAVCRRGVNNGGIAPGPVTPALAAEIRDATGNQDFEGDLSTGYLVYVPPLEPATAGLRTPPPFSVWLKGNPAAHFVDANLLFVR